MKDINQEEHEPPSVVDIITRCFSAVGLLCREVWGVLSRVDSLYRLHGIGLHRCHFNLLDIRAEEQG